MARPLHQPEAVAVFIHGKEVARIEELPNRWLALTVEVDGQKTALLLDRAAVNLVTTEGNRMRRQASR